MFVEQGEGTPVSVDYPSQDFLDPHPIAVPRQRLFQDGQVLKLIRETGEDIL